MVTTMTPQPGCGIDGYSGKIVGFVTMPMKKYMHNFLCKLKYIIAIIMKSAVSVGIWQDIFDSCHISISHFVLALTF